MSGGLPCGSGMAVLCIKMREFAEVFWPLGIVSYHGGDYSFLSRCKDRHKLHQHHKSSDPSEHDSNFQHFDCDPSQ